MPTLRVNNKNKRNFFPAMRGSFSGFKSTFTNVSSFNSPFKSKSSPTLRKTPTMRGAFPKAVRFSTTDDGMQNARLSHDKALNFNRTAQRIRLTGSNLNNNNAFVNSRNFKNAGINDKYRTNSVNNRLYGTPNSSKLKITYGKKINAFDGNAAVKLGGISNPVEKPVPEIPQPSNQPYRRHKKNSNKKNIYERVVPNFSVLKGQSKAKTPFQTAAFSPFLLTCTKFIAAIVIVCATVCFVRVGFSAATVSSGIETQNLSNQISQELNTKNSLEVKDSTLSNSGRVRAEANKYSMVAPDHVEQINLGKDILAYEGNDVSLVESINRLANSAK